MYKTLTDIYNSQRIPFNSRLRGFKKVWTDGDDSGLFAEMCYCVLTSREKAVNALHAVETLKADNSKLLLSGNFSGIDKALMRNKIALHPQKAKRIVDNRSLFYPGTKNKLLTDYIIGNIFDARKKLMRDVHGFGMKEASHFLRNIGFGKDLAILDRHIINQLKEYGIIDDTRLTARRYLEIEEKMKTFAQKIKIPFEVLDMVLMYLENSEVIK